MFKQSNLSNLRIQKEKAKRLLWSKGSPVVTPMTIRENNQFNFRSKQRTYTPNNKVWQNQRCA
jgi:hypothetical protein